MVFNTGAALLDAIVLAVVSKEPEGTYGYKITQDVRQIIDLSESTLYPVLRRLQKDDCLEVYDRECAGRNRRYYKVTSRNGRRPCNIMATILMMPDRRTNRPCWRLWAIPRGWRKISEEICMEQAMGTAMRPGSLLRAEN